MKKLQIPPPLTNACPAGMGFPASRMQDMIETPDQQHRFHASGLIINLFAKYTPSYTDLVMTAMADESTTILPVAFAFRAFTDDYPTALSEMSPLDVLKAFIAIYGLPVRVAGQTKPLHLRETITLTGTVPGQNLVEVDKSRPTSVHRPTILPAGKSDSAGCWAGVRCRHDQVCRIACRSRAGMNNEANLTCQPRPD